MHQFKSSAADYGHTLFQRLLIDRKYLSERAGTYSWRITAHVPATSQIDHAEALQKIQHELEPLLSEIREENHQNIHTEYTGVMPVVSRTQRILLNDLFKSFLTAFGLVALVMMLVLRNVRAGLIAMLPNVYPAIVIFGTMGWFNIPVDIGAMMTASIALGIAVDDTLHFLTWFRLETSRGHNRAEAVRCSMRHCGRAMIQTTVICSLGMIVFTLSGFIPTQRFAWLMLALLSATLAGDLIFLPALLNSPLGRLFVAQPTAQP